MAFDKIPIVELMERYGVDLIEQGYDKNVYYKALCPLHDETVPSFAVYPNSGRFVCFAGCGQGDVIDFVKLKEQCSYIEAKRICTTEVSPVDSMMRDLSKFSESRDTIDVEYLKLRSCHAFDRPRTLDIQDTQKVLCRFDVLIRQEKWFEADALLRGYNL